MTERNYPRHQERALTTISYPGEHGLSSITTALPLLTRLLSAHFRRVSSELEETTPLTIVGEEPFREFLSEVALYAPTEELVNQKAPMLRTLQKGVTQMILAKGPAVAAPAELPLLYAVLSTVKRQKDQGNAPAYTLQRAQIIPLVMEIGRFVGARMDFLEADTREAIEFGETQGKRIREARNAPVVLDMRDDPDVSFFDYLARIAGSEDVSVLGIIASTVDSMLESGTHELNVRFSPGEREKVIDFRSLKAELDALDALDQLRQTPQYTDQKKLTPREKLAFLAARLQLDDRLGNNLELLQRILQVDQTALEGFAAIAGNLSREYALYSEVVEFVVENRKKRKKVLPRERIALYYWSLPFLRDFRSDRLKREELGDALPAVFRESGKSREQIGGLVKEMITALVGYGELPPYKENREQSYEMYCRQVVANYIAGRREQDRWYLVSRTDATAALIAAGVPHANASSPKRLNRIFQGINERPTSKDPRTLQMRSAMLNFIPVFNEEYHDYPKDLEIAQELERLGFGEARTLLGTIAKIMHDFREDFPARRTGTRDWLRRAYRTDDSS